MGSARLQHFNALFSSNMREAQERAAEIDAGTAEVQALLQYLYTSELPEACDATLLLPVAHHHDLTGLIELCAERISAALRPDNAVATVRALKLYAEHPSVAP